MAKQKRPKNKKNAGGFSKVNLPIGRPKSFDTADDFADACRMYFRALKKWNKPNIAGICLFLNIARDTWYDYKKNRKELRETIDAVENAIEMVWVDKLGSSYATGAIFYLKNFRSKHYKDTISGDPDQPLYPITGMRVVREKK